MPRLSLAGTELAEYHVCAFFNSRDEEYAVLSPFFNEAVAQGEKNLHIVNPVMRDEHLRRLGEAGMDTGHCAHSGQLEALPWHEAYIDDNGQVHAARRTHRTCC